MIRELINEFRRENGRHPIRMDNWEENQNCLWHCLYMARIQELCHAPEHLRPGKSEACAVRGFFHNPNETLYDYAGGATLQTSETISADGYYYFWFNKDLCVPYVRVVVTATNTDANDLLAAQVYVAAKE